MQRLHTCTECIINVSSDSAELHARMTVVGPHIVFSRCLFIVFIFTRKKSFHAMIIILICNCNCIYYYEFLSTQYTIVNYK